MRTKVKKYFITYLSLVLILSNFSFATTLMLCKMSGKQISCTCSHNQTDSPKGIAFSKIKNPCCDEKTIELSNSNTLTTVKNDLTGNFLALIDVINAGGNASGLNIINASRINNQFSYHPPNSEIPILHSSLLI